LGFYIIQITYYQKFKKIHINGANHQSTLSTHPDDAALAYNFRYVPSYNYDKCCLSELAGDPNTEFPKESKFP
jgi:hypothetical protein